MDLSGRDLKNFDLTGANLTNANLTGANLTGATGTGATLTGVVGEVKRVCYNGKCGAANMREVLVICGGELRGGCNTYKNSNHSNQCDGTSACPNHNYR